jgi:hypothetical protein
MCPHTTANVCPHAAIYVSSNCYIRVLILLCMCPHTAIYVSSYCYICVLILVHACCRGKKSERVRVLTQELKMLSENIEVNSLS